MTTTTVPARGDSPYSLGERVRRLAWAFVQSTLFAWSFHNWYGFRRGLLRAFGARLGATARVRPSARIEIPWNLEIGDDTAIGDRAILYCLGPVRIGSRVTVSQGAHLCAGTHDHRTRRMTLLRLPITIGDDAWIAADAFVGPGVTVGEGAILGARSVAMSDLGPWGIYAGHPAMRAKDRARPAAD